MDPRPDGDGPEAGSVRRMPPAAPGASPPLDPPRQPPIEPPVCRDASAVLSTLAATLRERLCTALRQVPADSQVGASPTMMGSTTRIPTTSPASAMRQVNARSTARAPINRHWAASSR